MENMNELDNITTLKDEDGSDVEFEFLDLIEYDGTEYVVLLPVEESDEADEVVILKLEESENEDEESYVGVEEQDVLNAVLRYSRTSLRTSSTLLINLILFDYLFLKRRD